MEKDTREFTKIIFYPKCWLFDLFFALQGLIQLFHNKRRYISKIKTCGMFLIEFFLFKAKV